MAVLHATYWISAVMDARPEARGTLAASARKHASHGAAPARGPAKRVTQLAPNMLRRIATTLRASDEALRDAGLYPTPALTVGPPSYSQALHCGASWRGFIVDASWHVSRQLAGIARSTPHEPADSRQTCRR